MSLKTGVTRRTFLSMAGSTSVVARAAVSLSSGDEKFLDDLCRRAFLFFWEQGNPDTGLVLDRARANGTAIAGRNLEAASTALTGFYLSALCLAHQRRWMELGQIEQRVRRCVLHLLNNQEHVHGWYYHFVNRKTGERIWDSELSSIDSALLLAGVITVQQYFSGDADIADACSEIYSRVDFPWLTDPRTGFIRMGWRPSTGYLRAEWVDYREQSILQLLAIASPSYPLNARSWYLFERDPITLAGYTYLGRGPIFTHQYSQAWMSLKGFRDGPPYEIDYFQNSIVATYALRQFCLNLRGMFPGFSENLWGVTPSDSDIGYLTWGSPTSRRDIDGTVVPCAAGGSLMFAPEICLPSLQYMYQQFAELIYGRYGFVDAFHPVTGWVNPDVVGIDVGITLLSAENLRSGNIWRWFNRSPDIQRGMRYIFEPANSQY